MRRARARLTPLGLPAMLRRLGRAGAALGASAGCGLGAWHYYSTREWLPPLHSALQPGKSLRCRLLHSETLTHDTSRFRFELPTPEHVLGLPTASHIVAVDGAMVYRECVPRCCCPVPGVHQTP